MNERRWSRSSRNQKNHFFLLQLPDVLKKDTSTHYGKLIRRLKDESEKP